jgi:hypothetical protein
MFKSNFNIEIVEVNKENNTLYIVLITSNDNNRN